MSPTKFFALRKRERVWLFKGDIFFDTIIARIKEIDRLLAEPDIAPNEALELRTEKEALEQEDAFAKERIAQYCQSHRDLEFDEKTCVVSLDFTAIQTSMRSKFCDFVLVIATQSPITIPDSMLDEKLVGTIPPSMHGHGQLVLDNSQKKKRRTKIEMMDVQKPEVKPNLRDDIEKHHKKKKLPQVVANAPNFKPALTYLHFVISRNAEVEDEDGKTEEVNVSQTFDYVQWVLEFLEEHEFFSDFERIKFWSDGCGKHFKTYASHYFMASYQERLGIPVTWDFLAPNRGLF